MKIEHIGLLVLKPISMGHWYRDNLGFRIIRELGADEDGVIFMEDNSGMVIEIARVRELPPLNLKAMNSLSVHLAVECANPSVEAMRLIEAGAEIIGESIRNEYPGEKVLIRDPFGGLTIQLINRKNALKKKE